MHPYQKGYSVLPQLEKLDQSPFVRDENYDHYIAEKKKACENQQVYLSNNTFLLSRVLTRLQDIVKEHADWVKKPYTFSNIAMQLQEDIAVHSAFNGRDCLEATHICFPSSWRPEEKIGKPLSEIHASIPGINLDNSYKIAELASKQGPFQRFVWSPIFEDKINFHPDLPKAEFNPKKPFIKVKVEKQITYPLPELGCFLFILRQYIVDPILPDLYKACAGMTDEQKKYKGIKDNFLQYLGKLYA